MTYKILIVEDESIVGASIMQTLTKAGYEVTDIAITGEQAVQSAKRTKPDLALMDINLKGSMDGIETAAQIQALYPIPVIYLTAHADPDSLERAKTNDTFGYVVKPFQGHNLIATIEIARHKHQLEKQLRQSEARYRAVIEQTTDGIYLFDLDTKKVIEANPALLNMLGYTADEILEKTVYDLIDVSPDLITQTLQEMVRNNSLFSGENNYIHRDNHKIPVEVTVNIITYHDRKVICSVVRDISERKQLEASIASSQKMNSLGTLSAGIAHEVNSPLQVIINASEGIIKRSRQDNINLEYLQKNADAIRRNAWRIADIIRSLRTYTQPSSGLRQPHDVNALILETLPLIKSQLKSWANIQITTSLADNLPPLLCDQNQIMQAIINLLMNARDTMPRGGNVSIRTSHIQQKDQIAIKVIDEGEGIPEDIRDKIFDPFFTTKPIGQGTGLGLSVVMGIVKAHNGEITLESNLDRGSIFTLLFPIQ